VKEINHVDVMKFFDNKMNDVLQNGVTYTGGIGNPNWMGNKVEDTIENGVKKTKRSYESSRRRRTKDTIENGVKEIRKFGNMPVQDVEDIIQNGVLETKELYWENTPIIDDVIENGINQTKAAFQTIYNPMNFSPEIREEKRISDVIDVIDNGVKEIQPLPAQDGNRDWGNYYHRQEDRTKPHTEYVNDAMSSGIKKTIWRKVENFPEYENRIIVNGVLINNSKDWEIL